MSEPELSEAFDLYAKALSGVIADAIGWDETYQRGRFQSRYLLDWFQWVEVGSRRIGYVCTYRSHDEIHVSLLIVFEEFQGKSFGQQIMMLIHQLARQENRKVALSSFKNNDGAVRFYQRLGYKIVGQDEHFYDMVLDRP